jgi:hypothetical protein
VDLALDLKLHSLAAVLNVYPASNRGGSPGKAIEDSHGLGAPGEETLGANRHSGFHGHCARDNGTFKAVKTYPSGGDGAVSVAVADLNKDGKPDFVVANCGPLACGPGSPGGNVGVLIGNGNGTFEPVVNYPAANSPFDVVAADVNNDGKLDIAVSNWGTPNAATNDGAVTILQGKGNGTFRPAQTFPSGGAEAPWVAVADVNKDGRLDIVLACVADALNQSSTGVVTVLINATKSAPRSAQTAVTIQ